MTAAPDLLTFRVPPARGESKMSVSGFKAKLKLLASVFHKNQEPPPQLRLHCNITPIVFKEKLTMKTDSLMEEKLECSLWCCLNDPSPRAAAVFWKGALYPGCSRNPIHLHRYGLWTLMSQI
ncbi:uncharacterized protein LOC100935705 [Pongo abelii]|uniref:uncharacterized protein LOC100935705 n=1 Tax=Pongo abelii TaxID=9601 RepID=UPI0023E7D3B2|nr:uncharacterized protein LOC100935705 [Pongo abelii]